GRQLIQLGSSTVKSGSTIISGPLGTGTITVSHTTGSDQGAPLVAWGADRTLDTPITFTTTGTTFNFASTNDGDTQHTLTLGGTITVPGNGSLILGNTIGASCTNFRNGSGNVNINGDIQLTG